MPTESFSPEQEGPLWGLQTRQSKIYAKLRCLRDLNGHMTRGKLAVEAGIDVSLIQNYEQEKSPAKDGTVIALAEALDALSVSLFACSLDTMKELDEKAQIRLAAQLLFQIASAYDLDPYSDDEVAGVKGNDGYVEYALAEWTELHEADDRDTRAALGVEILPEDYRAVQDHMVGTFAKLDMFELDFFDGAFEASDRRPALPLTLGETLKRLCKAKGLSQGGLAKAAGISAPTVCACEQDKRTPNDEQCTAMAGSPEHPSRGSERVRLQESLAAWHFLIEFAHIYGLVPKCVGEIVNSYRRVVTSVSLRSSVIEELLMCR